LVAAGLSWTSTISTLVAELQLFLPRWVMARGMAIWTRSSPAAKPSEP